MERFGNSTFHASHVSAKQREDGLSRRLVSPKSDVGGSVAKTDLSRRLVATKWNEDGSQTKAEADTCRKNVVPTCLGDLPRRSRAKAGALVFAGWENVAKIFGKFGGADHLRNLVRTIICQK